MVQPTRLARRRTAQTWARPTRPERGASREYFSGRGFGVTLAFEVHIQNLAYLILQCSGKAGIPMSLTRAVHDI
jgi:hypothetical protein